MGILSNLYLKDLKMIDKLEEEKLAKKLEAAAKNAAYQKERYWRYRLEVIKYLGGKCECGEDDPKNLEIHHDPPLLQSEKKNGFPRGPRSGESRIREWREILSGKNTAKLTCKNCHKTEHGWVAHAPDAAKGVIQKCQ